MTYVACLLADEHHTASNKSLVNFSKLNCILKSEIFVHRDGQLWELHVILGFNLISKHFQSPKHIIRAKDPRLALINVAIPSFLTIAPPPSRTQDAQSLALLVAKLLYSQKLPIPSDDDAKKRTPKATQKVTNKDFEVFYKQEDPENLPGLSQRRLLPAQINTNKEEANIPKGMVLKEKTPNLLALLTAHVRGASQEILVVPRPPTTAHAIASSSDTADKKRKKGQGI